jgi:hypothetical protein
MPVSVLALQVVAPVPSVKELTPEPSASRKKKWLATPEE